MPVCSELEKSSSSFLLFLYFADRKMWVRRDCCRRGWRVMNVWVDLGGWSANVVRKRDGSVGFEIPRTDRSSVRCGCFVGGRSCLCVELQWVPRWMFLFKLECSIYFRIVGCFKLELSFQFLVSSDKSLLHWNSVGSLELSIVWWFRPRLFPLSFWVSIASDSGFVLFGLSLLSVSFDERLWFLFLSVLPLNLGIVW